MGNVTWWNSHCFPKFPFQKLLEQLKKKIWEKNRNIGQRSVKRSKFEKNLFLKNKRNLYKDGANLVFSLQFTFCSSMPSTFFEYTEFIWQKNPRTIPVEKTATSAHRNESTNFNVSSHCSVGRIHTGRELKDSCNSEFFQLFQMPSILWWSIQYKFDTLCPISEKLILRQCKETSSIK